MAFTSGPVAAVTAALLTLSESSTIINLLARSFLMQDALLDTFDATLVGGGCEGYIVGFFPVSFPFNSWRGFILGFLGHVQKDSGGFDVLVVDAMHRANFASRICHSCKPNCEAK